MWKSPEIRKELVNVLKKEVTNECAGLCSRKESPFKLSKENVLKQLQEFTFADQEKELESVAPLLWNLVLAGGTNARSQSRNKKKTASSIKPALISSVASILRSRNMHINMNATLNALMLRRGGADKMTFKRLYKLALCTSYGQVLRCQEKLGVDTLSVVRSWTDEVSTLTPLNEPAHDAEGKSLTNEEFDEGDLEFLLNDELDDDLQECLQHSMILDDVVDEVIEDDDILNVSATLQSFSIEGNVNEHVSVVQPYQQKEGGQCHVIKEQNNHFILAGDNVNLSVRAKHTSREKGNKQLNLFNCIATKARVPFIPGKLKSRISADVKPHEVDLTALLPGKDEDKQLKSDFKHIVGSILAKHIDEVSWFDKYLRKYWHHEFIKQLKTKSETVSNLNSWFHFCSF